jgi:hypothetical protein
VHRTRALAFGLGIGVLVPALGGCPNREENRRCTDALLAGKGAVAQRDPARAAAALASAKESCPDDRREYIEHLSQQIDGLERELERNAARVKEEQKVDPLRTLVDWAERRRDASDRRGGDTTCVERGDPDYGWCSSRSETEGGTKIDTRYWKADQSAVLFETTLAVPVTCLDVGPHRVVRAWTTAAGAKRQHCELTGGKLTGLTTLVTVDGDRSVVGIFSPQYVRRDAGFRQVLEREGR